MENIVDDGFSFQHPEEEKFIDLVNYADDRKTVSRAKELILGKLDTIRSQRATLEQLWQDNEKLWDGKHSNPVYRGESDAFIPMGQQVVETMVAQTIGQLFPNDIRFHLAPTGPYAQEAMAAQAEVSALQMHNIEQANVMSKTPLFLRRGFINGPSIIKNRYEVQTSTNYRRRPGVKGDYTFKPEVIKHYEGPTFDIVDVMRWYIHPITAKNLSEYRIVFEDLDVDYTHLATQEARGRYLKVKRVKLTGQENSIVTSNRDERINSSGYSVSDAVSDDRYRLTEIWCKFDLYGDGNEVACKMVACGDVILELRQNPNFQQRPPYRVWRYCDKIDNFYGTGMLEKIRSLQNLFNGFANMTVDNAVWQMNPLMVVNKTMLASDPADIAAVPRQIIYTWANPGESISFERPPETWQIGVQMMQVIGGLLQDVSRVTPQMQGRVGDTAQSATESSNLAANASATTSSVAQKIADEVLTPMLYDWYILEQQYRDDDTYFQITGKPPVRISPAQLVGDYKFTWNIGARAAQTEALQATNVNGGVTALPGVPQEPAGMPRGQGAMDPAMAAMLGMSQQ